MQVYSDKEIYSKASSFRLDEILSIERFNRYLAWAGNDRPNAFQLYALNTQLSESLYTSLQMLEIALRNRIHVVMSEKFSEYWFDEQTIMTTAYQQKRIKNAKKELSIEGKPLSPSGVIAKLMLGFWTTLLNRDHVNLWHQCLYQIAESKKRKHLAHPLAQIRLLRNRIAHHEPILHWDLPAHHQKILTTPKILSNAAFEWRTHHCRFEAVWGARPVMHISNSLS